MDENVIAYCELMAEGTDTDPQEILEEFSAKENLRRRKEFSLRVYRGFAGNPVSMKSQSSHKGNGIALSIYRRAEAAQLLEWSRTLEEHGLSFALWKSREEIKERVFRAEAKSKREKDRKEQTERRMDQQGKAAGKNR